MKQQICETNVTLSNVWAIWLEICAVQHCTVYSRMDQIFGNRCLTWRMLRMCRDVAKMTTKRFSVLPPCTANGLKVPHRLTDSMTKQTKTTSGIVVSFPFLFRFRG